MAQALVRFLAAQHVERDGVERRFFEGCFEVDSRSQRGLRTGAFGEALVPGTF
jgi:3D-(3,5/4)-trihydroxycyclohexane-1,2-dione acylhydrolase (decyclizing)